MDGPRPKRRGPKSGESVGGVCPDEAEWAVKRVRRVKSPMKRERRRGSSDSMKTWKCVSG